MNSCVSEIVMLEFCALLYSPSPSTAEKQNCAFLLIPRDNCTARSLLQIAANTNSCLEVCSYTESLCVAERKLLH